jgi:hypothetical protein
VFECWIPRLAVSTSDRFAIEARLSEELQAVRAAYYSATEQFNRTVEDCKDRRMKSHDVRPVEDQEPVLDTLRTHQDARVKYDDALKSFNDLIQYGTIPTLGSSHV